MIFSSIFIWVVDVLGSLLMIIFSLLCLQLAVKLKGRDPNNIVWAYLLWVCVSLSVFAVSRSAGHIVKQFLYLSSHAALWESIRPYSGAVNSFTFMVVGAVTLFFERTWNIYQQILKDKQALQSAHAELLFLNQNLEKLVVQRTEAMAASELKYQRIFQGSKDMLLVTRVEGEILDVNPAGVNMLGLTSDAEARGRPLQSFLSRAEDWQTITEAIAGQEFISSAEFDLRLADGSTRRVILSASLDRGLAGEADSLHFLVKDIEQSRLLREQLAQADKLASIGELSAGIAHEINNPLGIILGYTQLLLRNDQSGSERYADLKTIEKHVSNCQSIVQDLLNFARTSPPKKEMTDLHRMIEEALHFVQYQGGLEQIEVIREFDSRITSLLVDEKKIKQVLINLIMNAKHAIGKKGTLSICTATNRDASKVLIRIKDTGHGIEKKNLARIFDPFFTTKPTGQGTGLGLSVSYGIIKNHGGNIFVESEPPRGAAFTIELPLAPDPRGR
jgi:two-component system NtrC family sensor kinase